jgi:hypothetical protein
MTELYRDTLENAQGRAEYWKANSLDATREIDLLQGDLKRLEAALDTAVGEKWRTDSRLEEWFPLTAERLAKLAPLTREQIDAVMTEHYPLSSLLREEVDAFERCVRDIERILGIGA